MDSFFNSHVVHWLPITYVFSNLRTFHNNHAYMDNYDTDHTKTTICLENCTEFPDPQSCIDYCHAVQNTWDQSNTVDPLRLCRDWRCCKQLSGTNDYAYVHCMEGVRSKKTHRDSHGPFLVSLLVAMTFVLIFFSFLYTINKCT